MKRIPQHWLNWRMALLDDTRLTFQEVAMGLFLNTYMNEQHDFAFPTIATIAGRLRISHTSAVKYLSGLEEKGWIVKQKRFGQSTMYYATVPSVFQELEYSLPESGTQYSESWKENNQSNKQSNNNNTQDDNFDQFWTLYPRKLAKKPAIKAWSRLKPSDREAAIAFLHTRPYAETALTYVPYPATFLNQERWNDDTNNTPADDYTRGLL